MGDMAVNAAMVAGVIIFGAVGILCKDRIPPLTPYYLDRAACR